MHLIETGLDGVFIIEPKVFGDNRGFFLESYQRERYVEKGLPFSFIQDNISRSRKGVLRGLHYQKTQPQGKLIFVIRGSVFDVVVDIRVGSPTFGKWISVVLSDDNHRQVCLPPGCAHGFCVLSDEVDFIYKCTDYYHSESEVTILWDDPDLKIDWPIENPILSEKDQRGLLLKEIPNHDFPIYSSRKEK